MRICHVTTVHARRDPRIFAKQARSAAAAGHDVTLVVADGKGDALEDGVQLRDVGKAPFGRLGRILIAPIRTFRAAVAQRPDVLHVHDPELLPTALLVTLASHVPVIYDVHEDNVAFVHHKAYLPGWSKRLVANVVDRVERFAARVTHVVIAERAYAKRFPYATLIANYPDLTSFHASTGNVPEELTALSEIDAPLLVYTGNVSEERGALHHARLVHLHPDVHVVSVGYTPHAVADAMRTAAGPEQDRLHLIGEDRYVDHAVLRAALQLPNAIAGLALFPRSPFYDEKELTKFFEYMAAGLPTLASDAPTWRHLLEEEARCGVTVNPRNDQALTRVLEAWIYHPERAYELGRNGRRIVEERYTWRAAQKPLLALYERTQRSGGPST